MPPGGAQGVAHDLWQDSAAKEFEAIFCGSQSFVRWPETWAARDFAWRSAKLWIGSTIPCMTQYEIVRRQHESLRGAVRNFGWREYDFLGKQPGILGWRRALSAAIIRPRRESGFSLRGA